MAQTLTFKDEIPYSAEAVMELMLDPVFIEQWTVVQKGIDPKVRLAERNDDSAKMLIDLKEPLPVGTVKANMEFNWDIKNFSSSWKRSAEGVAAKSKVWGGTKIIPQGENSCLFTDEINIEVSIPMMGKKMEKMVASYLKEGRVEKMDFLRRKLAG